ncbi:MAG: tRNA uridine-5-carboxymethylaminomethyl(34) synthesis GTPase MnmE [Lachnospiraceae bacterium]|nr:tRNA uridine-5-carboxymethylaminomethyl(34) synthesis GTPase MnmE [Lachnospiraceae bacterium]
MNNDTIAAIASGLSAAGISIIRISGPDAFGIASKLFRTGRSEGPVGERITGWESHTVHYGYIADGDEIIDEVMLLILKAPRTFTKEDTVEIDCHGGIVVTKRILSLVLSRGARLAEPGEFTKRAFLNGRIDLSQAEAVMELIGAKNELAVKNSVKQLRGTLRDRINALRTRILSDVATIEASLDQPEYYSLEGFAESLSAAVKEERADIGKMLRSAENGRMIREGIVTVILGKPNVGKSSLMNALVGEERAIVTEIAGTTRDTLSEEIRLNGITLLIVDTAGIRNTPDPVEKIGVSRAHEKAEDADLILYVADASTALDQADRDIIKAYSGKKMLAVLNKSDLAGDLSKEKGTGEDYISGKTDGASALCTTEQDVRKLLSECGCEADVVSVSAKEGTGLSNLEEKISAMFFAGDLAADEESVITSERHKECLRNAFESLGKVLTSIENGLPEDFYSIDLMGAYEALSRIVGEDVDEDLINRIFERFCLGK